MGQYDVLSNMLTINIDLETLGVNPVRDQIYSGAVYSTKTGTGALEAPSFFDIDGGNYPSNMPLEDFMASRHSSQFFGASQQSRGSLKGWAESINAGQATILDEFAYNILRHKNTYDEGAILLAQNISFEDRALSTAYNRGQLSSPFTDLTSQLVGKGQVDKGLYLQDAEIKQMSFDRNAIIDSHIKPAIKAGSKDALQQGLQSYYDKSFEIIDKYAENFNTAKTTNRIATADLMDFTKAIYAHGALQGKIDPRLLTYGAKVDFLSEAILKQPELHEAMSDAKQQDELFRRMTAELKNMKEQGLSYNSPMVDELAAAFKPQRVLEKQIKSGAISFIREYLESPNNNDVSLEGIQKGYRSAFNYRNRFIADEGTVEGFNFNTFREDLDNIIKTAHEKQTSKGTGLFDRGIFLNDLEEGVDEYVHTPRTKDTAKGFFEKHMNKRNLAIAAGAGAAVFGLNMMLGGNKEKQREVKYNTYDELYNSQYYGSQFADWQNRNNSHRMM